VKTSIRVLPTRWRRKRDGIEITSLSRYVYTEVGSCEWREHRLYVGEVLELRRDVSVIVLLPAAHNICSAPGHLDPRHAAAADVLPIQIFDISKCQTPLHGPDPTRPDQTKSAELSETRAVPTDFVGDPGRRPDKVRGLVGDPHGPNGCPTKSDRARLVEFLLMQERV